MSEEPASSLEIIAAALTPYLGPNTARVAAKVSTERATGRSDGALAPDEAERVLGILRPMLRTLLGRSCTEVVLLNLTRDLAPP